MIQKYAGLFSQIPGLTCPKPTTGNRLGLLTWDRANPGWKTKHQGAPLLFGTTNQGVEECIMRMAV